MWVDSVSAPTQSTVQFSLKVSNVQDFIAFQTDVQLPNSLEYVLGSAQLTARSNGHQLAVSLINSQTIRVIAFSYSSEKFIGSSGAVLTFNCSTKTPPGTSLINLINPLLGDTSQQNILTGWNSGSFTLLAPAVNFNLDSLHFGSLPLGQFSDRALKIYNRGTTLLNVYNLTSSQSEIRFLDTNATVIAAGDSISRSVRFQPIAKGNKVGYLHIRSNDPSATEKSVLINGNAYAVNEIQVGSVFGRSGFSAELKINISNMETFSAFEFDLNLPNAMQYVPGSANLTLRKSDHIIFASSAGSKLHVVAYSPTNSCFLGASGDVATFSFQLSGAGGFYLIGISNAVIGDSAGNNIISASYSGTLEIAAPHIQLSSSYLDFGEVSILDTAWRTLSVSNNGSDTLNVNLISINHQSFTNSTPTPMVILPGASSNLYLSFHNATKGTFQARLIITHNDITQQPSFVDLTAKAFAPNRLSVVSKTGKTNDSLRLPFTISNTEPFVAFQFDVTLPSNLQYGVESVLLSSRAQGHNVSAAILPNGDLRILAFSLSQNSFTGNSGEVVSILMNAGSTTGTVTIAPKNVIIGDSANQNIATGGDTGFINIMTMPNTPDLISPSNGTINIPTTPVMRWSRDENAETYHIQVADDSNFTTLLINDSTVVDTFKLIGPLQNLKRYFWRVKAQNIIGESSFSIQWQFTTIIALPNKVELLAPMSSADITSDTVNFLWYRAEPGVDRYWFDLSYDSVFSIHMVDSTVTDTTTSRKNLIPNQFYWWRVRAHNSGGWGQFSNTHSFRIVTTSIFDGCVFPNEYRLSQNYPNPFNPTTEIKYALPEVSRVRLRVFDVLGREVAVLFSGIQEAGYHNQRWTPENNGLILSSGIYFCKLDAAPVNNPTMRATEIKKMLFVQ
jgi:hypothetical protein